MATFNDKTKAANRYSISSSSNNDSRYKNLNLNNSHQCSNPQVKSSLFVGHGVQTKAVSSDYNGLGFNHRQQSVIKEEPKSKFSDYFKNQGFEDKGSHKENGPTSNLNKSTLSLCVVAYEKSIEAGGSKQNTVVAEATNTSLPLLKGCVSDLQDTTQTPASHTSLSQNVKNSVSTLWSNVKSVLCCNDISNIDKVGDVKDRLPNIAKLESSKKKHDLNTQEYRKMLEEKQNEPLDVHQCDRCLKLFNYIGELLLHECSDATLVDGNRNSPPSYEKQMNFERFCDNQGAMVETDEDNNEDALDFHDHNFDQSDDTVISAQHKNECLSKAPNDEIPQKNIKEKGTAKSQSNTTEPRYKRITGAASLYNNPSCNKIMEHYASTTKKGQSFNTLAEELSKVLGTIITKDQAYHQYQKFVKSKTNAGPKLKQTKLNFAPKAVVESQNREGLKRKKKITVPSSDAKIARKRGKNVHDELLQRMENLENQNSQISANNTVMLNLLRKFMGNSELNDMEFQSLSNLPKETKPKSVKKVAFVNNEVSQNLTDGPESENGIESSEHDSGSDRNCLTSSSSIGSDSSGSDCDDTDYSEDDDNDKSYRKIPVITNKNGQVLMEYIIGQNSKLMPMIVVAHKNLIHTYTKTKSKNDANPPTTYYECNRCPRNSKDKSKAVMKGDEFWAYPEHSTECCPLTKKEFDELQLDRKIRDTITKGFKGYDAYRAGFNEASEKGLEIRDYENLRKSYDRLIGKSIPDSKKGKVAEQHKFLINGERWLIHEEKEIAVFSSELQLRTMGECKILMADPTFRTSPKGFQQTLYIHGLVEGQSGSEWRCLLMATMNTKTEESYKIVVNAIKEKWAELNIQPKFERFHTDYETALYKAFEELGGKEKIYGCLFHYDKAVLSNMKNLGLFSYYRVPVDEAKRKPEYKPIRRWIRAIMALPMLPKDDVLFLWDDLKNIPPPPSDCKLKWPTEKLQGLADYIQKNWIPLLTETNNNRWCFYKLGRTKNTNPSEGFHSGLNQTLPKKPKFKIFLDIQKSRFSMNEARIINITTTNVKTNWRNSKYTALAERIEKHEMDLEKLRQKDLNEEELLAALKHHCEKVSYELHDVRNKSLNTVKSGKKADGRKKYQLISDDEENGESTDDESTQKVKNPKPCSTLINTVPPKIKHQQILVTKDIKPESQSKTVMKDIKSDKKDVDILKIQKPFSKVLNTVPPIFQQQQNLVHSFKLSIKSESQSKAVISDIKNDEKDDDIKVLKEIKVKPAQRKIVFPRFQRLEIEGFYGDKIPAQIYNCIMPPPTPYTQSDLFIPPSLQQLQDILMMLDLPPELAFNSPLLSSVATEPEGKSMVTVHTRGDGNCGQRSLSTLFTGSEDHHWHIRLKIYQHIAVHGHRIYAIKSANLAKEYYEKYQRLKNMPPQRVDHDLYAGNDDFFALADMLDCSIYTYTPNPFGANTHITPHFKDNVKPIGAPTFFLMYLNDNHFEPIIDFI